LSGVQRTVSSSAVHRPIGGTKAESVKPPEVHSSSLSTIASAIGSAANSAVNDKNEIFVDILERLTVVLSSSGQVLHSHIDGCIQMKSYLKNRPELRLALNEDLMISGITGAAMAAGSTSMVGSGNCVFNC
jgi:AP-4 complex subunit mu-1